MNTTNVKTGLTKAFDSGGSPAQFMKRGVVAMKRKGLYRS